MNIITKEEFVDSFTKYVHTLLLSELPPMSEETEFLCMAKDTIDKKLEHIQEACKRGGGE